MRGSGREKTGARRSGLHHLDEGTIPITPGGVNTCHRVLCANLLRRVDSKDILFTELLQTAARRIVYGAIGGLHAFYVDIRRGATIFGWMTSKLASETAPRIRDKNSHSYPLLS